MPRINDQTLCLIASNLTMAFYTARGGTQPPSEQNVAQTYTQFIAELQALHKTVGSWDAVPNDPPEITAPRGKPNGEDEEPPLQIPTGPVARPSQG